MNTKIQIKSVLGKILFEYESEDNCLKKTLEEAVKQNKNLFGADLPRADLSKADLSWADLYKADLRWAHLSEAYLVGANLSKADLSKADLSWANLSGADLVKADLVKADLRWANLSGANLSGANLSGANLVGANLVGANLVGANFEDAKLRGTDLRGANLREAKNVPFIPLNLPEGEFIAYKKIKDEIIVKLKILEDSKRSRATGDKCRCDKALVLEFQDMDGNKLEVTEIFNGSYATCTYKVGEIVEADKWDDNRFNECSHGIHFFLDRQSAVDY